MIYLNVIWDDDTFCILYIHERELPLFCDFLELISGYDFWCLMGAHCLGYGTRDDGFKEVWSFLKTHRL